MPFTQADLALSTMWNYKKASSGSELMDQLISLGFHMVELNYHVKTEWIPEIQKYIDEGTMRVTSVHNVFPETDDKRFDTDSVLLGYEDESLRTHAVELGKQSIDWACRLGAQAVVFHPTEVPLSSKEYDWPLKKMIATHTQDSQEFRQLRDRMVENRLTAPYISQMLKSIEELTNYVESNHLPVHLGMENRAKCHQIPIFPEFDIIAERFDQSATGIWLDTGHAIMMMEMGLETLPLSNLTARNIVGMHIHDAVDGLDHYAPCTLPGHVLEPFRPYILKTPIKVLELSGRLSAEEITLGTQNFLKEFGE